MVTWLPKWALPKTFANQSQVRNYHGNYWDICVTFFSLLPPNMWFDDQNDLGPQYTEKYGPVCLAPVVCSCHPSSQHELFQPSPLSWSSLKIFCLQPCKTSAVPASGLVLPKAMGWECTDREGWLPLQAVQTSVGKPDRDTTPYGKASPYVNQHMCGGLAWWVSGSCLLTSNELSPSWWDPDRS